MVPGFTETNIFALYSHSLMPKQFFLPTSPPHHLRFKGIFHYSLGQPVPLCFFSFACSFACSGTELLEISFTGI